VNSEGFYDRFSTSKGARKSLHGRSSTSEGARESFYSRFSTSKEGREGTSKKDWSPWTHFMMLVVAFDLVFGFVRPLVAEPMRIPSESMASTLLPGDRVLTNKFVYDFADPDK
jgi:signal peptidase I